MKNCIDEKCEIAIITIKSLNKLNHKHILLEYSEQKLSRKYEKDRNFVLKPFRFSFV